MTTIVVGAAIIRDNHVLAQQRAHPPEVAGLWEFPGGRVEPGESDSTALARECWEELRVTVTVGGRIGPEVLLRPGLSLRLYQAILTPATAEPVAHEHEALRWLTASALDSVPWLPADRALLPAVRYLLGMAG